MPRETPMEKLTDDEAIRLMRLKVRELTDEEKAALKAHRWSKLPRELGDVGAPIDQRRK